MVYVAYCVSLTALQASLKLSNLLEADMVFSHSSNSLINSNEHCICKVLVVTRSAYLFTDFDKIPKSAEQMYNYQTCIVSAGFYIFFGVWNKFQKTVSGNQQHKVTLVYFPTASFHSSFFSVCKASQCHLSHVCDIQATKQGNPALRLENEEIFLIETLTTFPTVVRANSGCCKFASF